MSKLSRNVLGHFAERLIWKFKEVLNRLVRHTLLHKFYSCGKKASMQIFESSASETPGRMGTSFGCSNFWSVFTPRKGMMFGDQSDLKKKESEEWSSQ